MRMKFLHNKLLALSLGIVGFIIIIYKMLSEQSQCMPGEICYNKPPGDWKLKPYNGLDEDHPIRRRFLEEQIKAANKEREPCDHVGPGRTTQADADLYEMFGTKHDSPQNKEKILTKTEIKIKEVFVPQPCDTDLTGKQKYIRSCVTNEIIGKIPAGIQTVPFEVNQDDAFSVKESSVERERSFKRVYETSAWGKNWDPGYRDLNGSGRGATLSWTQEVMAALHVVINTIKVQLGIARVRLLDVPCGDMAWMSRFLLTRDDIEYTGIDIVPELIEHHKTTYKQFRWKFIKTDLLVNPLNQSYHLILCRMLLQHLYFRDVTSLLNQFSQSSSSFLLTTTFPGNQYNEELVADAENPGRVRKLNLDVPPLSLSPPYCLQRDGPLGDFEGWTHFVGLWKLPLTRVKNCSETFAMTYPGYNKVKMYSCTRWNL